MKKKWVLRLLALLVLATIAFFWISPYHRQLLFGPKVHDVPLYAWQEQCRRRALAADFQAQTATWSERLRNFLQGFQQELDFEKLSQDEQDDVWTTLLSDEHAQVRVAAITTLWNSSGWPKAQDRIIGLLDDPVEEVFRTAIVLIQNKRATGAPLFAKLFQLLKHPDPTRRGAAIGVLSDLHPKDKKLIDHIVILLDDADAEVRRSAALSLCQWQGRRMVYSALPKLTHCLVDSDAAVRVEAATTLAMLDISSERLIQTFKSTLVHQDAEIRRFAVVRLPNNLARQVFPELAHCARNTDRPHDLYGIVRALAHCGQAAVPLLLSCLDSTDRVVRLECLRSLGTIGVDAAVAIPALKHRLEELGEPAVSALAKIGKADSVAMLTALLDQPKLRRPALSSLSHLGLAAKSAASRVRALLTDRESDTRWRAAVTLAAIAGDDPETAIALEAMVDTVDSSNRIYVWQALRGMGPNARNVVPALTLRLQALDWPGHVARVLGAIGPDAKSAVPALLRLMNTRDSTLRSCAISALGNIGGDAGIVVPALLQPLHDRGDTKQEAIEALGRFGRHAKNAIPQITPFLTSSDELDRWYALEALIRIGWPADEAVPHLILRLHDQDERLRVEAAKALGSYGHLANRATVALCAMLDDDALAAIEAALDALAQIEP